MKRLVSTLLCFVLRCQSNLFFWFQTNWDCVCVCVSLIMHKGSMENAGQSLNQIECICQCIEQRDKAVSFSSPIAIRTEYMWRRKSMRKKRINVHLWLKYIFFILWNHLQLEYTCNAARYKIELRAGSVLTGVGTNLKLQRDLLLAAKRIDADVRFGFCRLKWPKFSFLRKVCEFIPC